MSDLCGNLGNRNTTNPYMVEMCARPAGHPGPHCPVLHKPGEEATCPRCAAAGVRTDHEGAR